MACTEDYMEYVCRQLSGVGVVRTRKMFGDYCVYVDEKPAVLVCDNIAYVKKHPVIEDMMRNAECGCPYAGAKEHYILDVDHRDKAEEVLRTLLPVLNYPKKKNAPSKV